MRPVRPIEVGQAHGDTRQMQQSREQTANALAATGPMPEWMGRAACGKAENPDDWYPDSTNGRGERADAARAICVSHCPVRRECLVYAFLTKQEHGIWGGLGVKERRRLRRKGNASPALADSLRQRAEAGRAAYAKQAAERTCKEVTQALKVLGPDRLTEKQLSVARARLEHPDDTVGQIAIRLDISKAAANGALRAVKAKMDLALAG